PPEEGAMDVGVRHEAGMLVLSVTDDGIGVEPELTESAFDLFAQGKRASARSQGGLGLGLALVRNLVELHGGTVRAESAGLGKGSTFTVRLPLAPVQSMPDAPARLDEAVAPASVLVVDDN
ncbi:sensor histidine kinase KdpD, partial [Achromobacter sp. GbtcB20]|uniref:sensor histidine kinase n=1 Tax=Achromobacter sp. GbtcB20 TaxID=2824765 RepID=UPI001C30D772